MTKIVYRSAVGLVAAVTVLMTVHGLLGMVAVWSDWLELQLLERAELGVPIMEDEGAINDLRQGALGTIQFALWLFLSVAFLMWVYRANKNARALGATDMTFGPGWSVGYYFIPILTLFRPYQAMKEIWRASHPGHWDDWRQSPSSPLLPLWWTLWIISNILNNIALHLSRNAEAIPELLTLAKFNLASNLVELPLALLAWWVVYSIYRMQEERFARIHGDPYNEYRVEALEGRRSGGDEPAPNSW